MQTLLRIIPVLKYFVKTVTVLLNINRCFRSRNVGTVVDSFENLSILGKVRGLFVDVDMGMGWLVSLVLHFRRSIRRLDQIIVKVTLAQLTPQFNLKFHLLLWAHYWTLFFILQYFRHNSCTLAVIWVKKRTFQFIAQITWNLFNCHFIQRQKWFFSFIWILFH